MIDQYLANPGLLEGQPKRAIADYVESADYVERNGILVPRRFATAKEARDSGLTILVRSEHRQDYDGVSGLLKSFTVTQQDPPSAWDDDWFLEWIRNINLSKFCALMGFDESEFKDKITYSIWEYLGGYNRTITADSAVEGRYHVTTNGGRGINNYSMVENGKIVLSENYALPPELVESMPSFIEFYESVRHLGRFDPNNCPIVEAQTIDKRHYFLQYHRTRDFKPAIFSLYGEPNAGELEVILVRGATPPEGIEFRTTVEYARNTNGVKAPLQEGASIGEIYGPYNEIMASRREVGILEGTQQNILSSTRTRPSEGNHSKRSRFFKPGLSVIIDYPQSYLLIPSQERRNKRDLARSTGENQYTDLHVVSDGRRAWIKRI